MKKIYLLLFVVIMIACKNDEPGLTVEQYLTAPTNGWVFESLIYTDPASGQQKDAIHDPDAFDECDLDNATIFTSDGKYIVAANTKCDPSDPAVDDTGTWTLNSDKTTLTIASTAGGPNIVITKLSANDTNIKGEIVNFLGFPITVQVTMKKK